jgi:hypothetical protein
LSATIRQKKFLFFFNFCFRSKILTSWFSYRGKSKSYVFIQQIKRFEWTFLHQLLLNDPWLDWSA